MSEKGLYRHCTGCAVLRRVAPCGAVWRRVAAVRRRVAPCGSAVLRRVAVAAVWRRVAPCGMLRGLGLK